MRVWLIVMHVFCVVPISLAQSNSSAARVEAEYYISEYAQHYRVPVALVRAIVKRESNWQPCTASPKGAMGLMQLMPMTAQRLGVRDRCNVDQNISGGVRYLAWLMQQFHDLRLVTAAYYAGEDVIGRRGLAYRNRDVVSYVAAIRARYVHEAGITNPGSKRDVR
jgi:soluble lytic murein transglycosylase-like protein